MRNFVDIPGGKIKRVTNRKDGNYDRRDEREDGFFEAGRQPHDARKSRRETRQLMRRVLGGEPLPTED